MTAELDFISRPAGRHGSVAILWVAAGDVEERIVTRRYGLNLSCMAVPTVKLAHGAVTGTRQLGETVTDGTTGATGQVVALDDAYTLVAAVSGTFGTNALAFGTSGATTTATSATAGKAALRHTLMHDDAQGGDLNISDGTAIYEEWDNGEVSEPTTDAIVSGVSGVQCVAADAPALFIFMSSETP